MSLIHSGRLECLPKVISESLEAFGLLRLTEARSGARVCDPQRLGFC
jgi:hypothetical protein